MQVPRHNTLIAQFSAKLNLKVARKQSSHIVNTVQAIKSMKSRQQMCELRQRHFATIFRCLQCSTECKTCTTTFVRTFMQFFSCCPQIHLFCVVWCLYERKNVDIMFVDHTWARRQQRPVFFLVLVKCDCFIKNMPLVGGNCIKDFCKPHKRSSWHLKHFRYNYVHKVRFVSFLWWSISGTAATVMMMRTTMMTMVYLWWTRKPHSLNCNIMQSLPIYIPSKRSLLDIVLYLYFCWKQINITACV